MYVTKVSGKKIIKFLYIGNEKYSWANRVLPYINSDEDLQTLNAYILDAVRASNIGNRRIGGLGYDPNIDGGCIKRTIGRNVKANRLKTQKQIDNYYSLMCMKKTMSISKTLYDALIRDIQMA